MRQILHTETEILHSLNQQLFTAEINLKQTTLALEEVSRLLPGYLHLNNSKSVAVEYIDNSIPEFYDISDEKVERDGFAALQNICHPEDIHRMATLLDGFLKREDTFQTLSVFIRLRRRNDPQNGYSWHFTNFKLHQINQVIGMTTPVASLRCLSGKMAELFREQTHLQKNFRKFSQLTKREKEILALLAKGYNNPDIADLLFISRRTVENHRKSIIKKLELKNLSHLIRFAYDFGLVR